MILRVSVTSHEPMSNIPVICFNKRTKRGLGGFDQQQCGVTLRPGTGFFDLGTEDAFK